MNRLQFLLSLIAAPFAVKAMKKPEQKIVGWQLDSYEIPKTPLTSIVKLTEKDHIQDHGDGFSLNGRLLKPDEKLRWTEDGIYIIYPYKSK